jgi:hypothetical protein
MAAFGTVGAFGSAVTANYNPNKDVEVPSPRKSQPSAGLRPKKNWFFLLQLPGHPPVIDCLTTKPHLSKTPFLQPMTA